MSEESSDPTDLFGDPWTPPRDPRGRKRHRPSPQGREIVAQLKAGGASEEEIALQLGLSAPTLKKYYFRELEHGVSLARNEVLRMLYAKAKGGNVTAMRAYLAETAKGQQLEAMRGSRQQQRPEKPLGKKEQRQHAANSIGGIFAPGPAPSRTH